MGKHVPAIQRGLLAAAGIALWASTVVLGSGSDKKLIEGEVLHTGMRITPTAAPGAVFQSLNPDLPDLPDYTAGQAVGTALSPDGQTLLVLTSGYNRVNGANGSRVAQWSNEYVFVYDVSGKVAVKKQALPLPNTFNGIAWHPDGSAFYVSGGRDDNVHFFARAGDVWAEQLPALDLGNHPSVSGGAYQPMAAGLAVDAAGRFLVVANMLYDSVTIVDLQSRTLVGDVDLRPGVADPAKAGMPGGSYPFWVVIKGEDKVYVSSQRDREVVILSLAGTPAVTGRIGVRGLPGKMILNKAEDLLFVAESNSDTVAIVDTESDEVITRIRTTAPGICSNEAKTFKGSNPNSLALVARRGNVVRHQWRHQFACGDRAPLWPPRRQAVRGHVTGLIPTGYYPNAVAVTSTRHGSVLHVANGMSNTGPNPDACRDNLSIARGRPRPAARRTSIRGS